MKAKHVYFFGGGKAEGNRSMKELLGGKGAGLAEMTNLGIPVPAGFTISTEVCTHFYLNGGAYPSGIETEIAENLKKVEKEMDARFGAKSNPLLLSIRSGARASMPGMMDTVLNLGLNDETVKALAASTGDERFAYDCYRRFIQMYGDVVLGLKPANKDDHDPFEEILAAKKREAGVEKDVELSVADLVDLIRRYRDMIRSALGMEFPSDPMEQLWKAIGAVFNSWNNDRAKTYRRLNGIPDSWGTAVNVQAMVFGNLGDDSGTGVAFTRNPATGENVFYGEYLIKAQGEDVVAGIRTPQPINRRQKGECDLVSLEDEMPAIYEALEEVRRALELHYADMQDLEFTIQKGRLWILQTRSGKRTGFAAIKIAIDMVREGLITKEEAIRRIQPEQLNQFLRPVFDPAGKDRACREGRLVAKGINAGPGAATGKVVFNAADAEEWAGRGERVILVRVETSPEDIRGMSAAAGILTATGGATSHAALVARQMGKVCVVGAKDLSIDYKKRTITVGGRVIGEGEHISIDGMTGEVIAGKIDTKPSEVLQVIIDKTLEGTPRRCTGISTSSWAGPTSSAASECARTPTRPRMPPRRSSSARGDRPLPHRAHVHGARSAPDRAGDDPGVDRERAARGARPSSSRCSRPTSRASSRRWRASPSRFASSTRRCTSSCPRRKKQRATRCGTASSSSTRRIRCSGTRGCRLGLQFPEIYEMQVRAIVRAAAAVEARAGEAPLVEIMHPLVGFREELARLRELTERVAAEEPSVAYLCGTMIELPRAACIRADEIAEVADFCSFGTNDLTQTALGICRDDTGSFLTATSSTGSGRPIRSRCSTRTASATSSRSASKRAVPSIPASRWGSAASTEASLVGSVLPPRRPRLRELLAVPRARRDSRGRPGRAEGLTR